MAINRTYPADRANQVPPHPKGCINFVGQEIALQWMEGQVHPKKMLVAKNVAIDRMLFLRPLPDSSTEIQCQTALSKLVVSVADEASEIFLGGLRVLV
jgi:hypothetical protein